MNVASDSTGSTDEQLTGLIVCRDSSDETWQVARNACEELYVRHARRLLAFLSARVHGSDLEDIHQGIWERVWERLPDGFHGGNFRAWLFQIARNYLIDHSRKRRPQPLDE